MWQGTLVVLIVSLAAWYVFRKFRRLGKAKQTPTCGCSGCQTAATCSSRPQDCDCG